MAGADEIGGAIVAVGERTHRVGALLGGNAGGEPVAHVHRHGESGAERRVVQGDHGIEMKALGLLHRQRRADDAGGVADDEGHLLRRAHGRRDEQIAFVLAVVVVGDDDDLAAREGGGGRFHQHLGFTGDHAKLSFAPGLVIAEGYSPGLGHGHAGVSPTWPRWRR